MINKSLPTRFFRIGRENPGMEVERNLPPSKPAGPIRSRRKPPTQKAAESVEHAASRVLFRRLPELLSRMVGSSREPGQVTFVFRLGYFDLAGLSQARREFFQETQTGLRIMVEVPDDLPGPKKPSLQLKVTPSNLKRLARRAAAQVRTERIDRSVKTSSSTVTTVTTRVEGRVREEAAVPSPLLRNLTQAVKAEDVRKLDLRPLSALPQKPWLKLAQKKKRRMGHSAPNWLRRREEMVWREPRQIGPSATQNAHSAERQPHCPCPGCGREMESTLLYCPECTMKAARYIQVPQRPRPTQSLIWLISQAVARH